MYKILIKIEYCWDRPKSRRCLIILVIIIKKISKINWPNISFLIQEATCSELFVVGHGSKTAVKIAIVSGNNYSQVRFWHSSQNKKKMVNIPHS